MTTQRDADTAPGSSPETGLDDSRAREQPSAFDAGSDTDPWPADAEQPPTGRNRDAAKMGRQQMRGSVLLLAGRLLSLGFTTATQVVLVRALTKADYGVFAYSFTIVNSGRILLSLGQGKLLSRFMSKYEEEKDYPRMFGALMLSVLTIAVTSTLLLLAYGLFPRQLLGSGLDSPRAVKILLVLMFCAPLQALDQVFVSLFAVMSRPTAIFFRKYVFTPVLQLVVVLGIAVLGGTVYQLALGYVITSFLGIAIYAVLFVRLLKDQGTLYRLRPRRLVLPFKDVFSFSIPTMTTEIALVINNMSSVIVLSAYGGAAAVADYRAVLPAARLNQVVYQTFVTMFLPMAARLFARKDHTGMRDTYWHSSIFLAVATFPIFVMTTVFAPATTVFLFGQRYADSGWVLASMAVGYYFSVALGFNAYVLQIYGRLRYLVFSNLGAVVFNLALTLALIPPFGALGAGIAQGATMVLQNIVNQILLNKILRAAGEDRSWIRPYAIMAASTAVLVLVEVVLHPGIVVAIVVGGVVSVAMLRLTRSSLQLADTFPELRRIPVVGKLVQ